MHDTPIGDEAVSAEENMRFTESHEWIREENGELTIGISTYAVEQLGDVVYVELPQAGATFEAGDVFGDIESVKAVSELFMPVSGEVVATNGEVQVSPELINEAPEEAGWLLRVRPANCMQLDAMMTRDQYRQYVSEQA